MDGVLDQSSGPFGEPTGNTSGIDADSLMSQIETGGSTQGSTASEPQSQPTPTEPQKAPQQTAAEIAFNWNGKQIKAPLTDPRVTQWVSQGYDYAQRMQAFKQQQSQIEQQAKLIEALEAKYKPVEEYYSQNPDRWEYINREYEKMRQGFDPANPYSQKFQELESKLSQAFQFIQGAQEKELLQTRQKEDQELDQEVQSIRQSFQDLDWDSADSDGKNLELKVLEHAQKIGTQSFRVAFRDLYHDQLLKKAEERAKEDVVKERQKQTKLGLLGQTPTPKKGITHADDYKHKSYDQLIAEGALELGITL